MNFAPRSILLIVAILLFVLALLLDDNWSDLVALGLAAFAASFVVDEVVGARGIGTRTTRDRD